MKHAYAFLLVVLLLLPAARLWAQNILMPLGNGVAASHQGCGGTVYDPGGSSTNYRNDQVSTLVLRPVLPSQRVGLRFTAFDLEQGYDFLEIYDGPDRNAPRLARLTGAQGLNATYAATNADGVLTLHLLTDPSVSRPGFAAVLNCLAQPGATAGNVGIGTAEPVEKLQVAGVVYSSQGGVRFPDGTLQTSAATDAQQLGLAGNTLSLTGGGAVTLPTDNLGNHTATQNLGLNGNWLSNAPGNANGLRIDNIGRVGIGTASPDRPLTIQAAGAGEQLLSLRTAAGGPKWHWNLFNGGLNLAESFVADYRLFIQDGGRVGIGTGAPQQALDVAGTVQAEAFAYPAAQERTLAVSPFAFTSTSSAAPVAVSGVGASLLGIHLTGTGLGYAVAPVALPVGAVVTMIELWALDNDNTANVATQARLVEYRPAAGSPVSINGTTHASLTGAAASTRTASAATALTISPDASYYVEYNANRSASCILQGVRLTYTVTQVQ